MGMFSANNTLTFGQPISMLQNNILGGPFSTGNNQSLNLGYNIALNNGPGAQQILPPGFGRNIQGPLGFNPMAGSPQQPMGYPQQQPMQMPQQPVGYPPQPIAYPQPQQPQPAPQPQPICAPYRQQPPVATPYPPARPVCPPPQQPPVIYQPVYVVNAAQQNTVQINPQMIQMLFASFAKAISSQKGGCRPSSSCKKPQRPAKPKPVKKPKKASSSSFTQLLFTSLLLKSKN